MKMSPMTMLLMCPPRGEWGGATIRNWFSARLGRPSLPDIITYPSTTSHTGVHVSTCGGGKNQPRININFSTYDVDSGQTAKLCSNVTICDVEKCIDLHHSRVIPIFRAVGGVSPRTLTRPCWSPSYGADERKQGEGVLSSQSFRSIRPVPAGHPKTPAD